mmetsp:Transcript_4863/g.8206  ORF Transcript_4863/g.8206 Transcript_4863/m.8206 type:complete len:237 (-) Transcript_4863:1287-1997(-)
MPCRYCPCWFIDDCRTLCRGDSSCTICCSDGSFQQNDNLTLVSVREQVHRECTLWAEWFATKLQRRRSAQCDCVLHKRRCVARDVQNAPKRRASSQCLEHVGMQTRTRRIHYGNEVGLFEWREAVEDIASCSLSLLSDECSVCDAVQLCVHLSILHCCLVQFHADDSPDRRRHRQAESPCATTYIEQHRAFGDAAMRTKERAQALSSPTVDLKERKGRNAEGHVEDSLLQIRVSKY